MRIAEYINKWEVFFSNWVESPEKTFKNNIWSQIYKGNSSFALQYDYLPQPFLGDPENCSIITLNLNPGPVHDIRRFPDGILVKKLIAKKSYFDYARSFPQVKLKNHPNKFWKKQLKWVFRLTGIDYNVHGLYPFAIEICPWHSNNWKSPDLDEKLVAEIQMNVFDVIDMVIPYATKKVVISVGKDYYHLFNQGSLGFEKLLEAGPKDYRNAGISEWPTNKKGKPIKRFFSLWKKSSSGTIYLNTYSVGSNTPPSVVWDEIQQTLISKYL